MDSLAFMPVLRTSGMSTSTDAPGCHPETLELQPQENIHVDMGGGGGGGGERTCNTVGMCLEGREEVCYWKSASGGTVCFSVVSHAL